MLTNYRERLVAPIRSGQPARVVAGRLFWKRQATESSDRKTMKGEATQVKRIFALVVSCFFLGPVLATADTVTTFNVSGQYSIELSTPAEGTFSGNLRVDTDSGTVTAVNVQFDEFAGEFNELFQSSPSGNNWELTAEDFISDKLQLTFVPFPNPGSLVQFDEGAILSGQVLDNTGDIAIFQGLTGEIAPALTSAAAPESSSLALVALGFLACLPIEFARRRVFNRD